MTVIIDRLENWLEIHQEIFIGRLLWAKHLIKVLRLFSEEA